MKDRSTLKTITTYSAYFSLLFSSFGSLNLMANKVKSNTDKTRSNNIKHRENLEHEKNAIENGGIESSCKNYSEYRRLAEENRSSMQTNVYNETINKIQLRVNQLNGAQANLENAQSNIKNIDGEEATAIVNEYNTNIGQLNSDLQTATLSLSNANDKLQIASAELTAARLACDNMIFCTSNERTRLNTARTDKQRWRHEVTGLQSEISSINNRKNELNKSMRNNSSVVTSGKNNISEEGATYDRSHTISGCNVQGDSSSTGCQLSGELFEKDKQITNLMNQGIEAARSISEDKEKKLYELELQTSSNKDFKLYSLAIEQSWNENYENSELTQVSIEKRRKSMKLLKSNLGLLASAGAIVKGLKCKRHPLSDAESKSYQLLRAGAATILIAQIQETNLSTNNMNCRANENYTSDKKDLQIKTIERAANVSYEAFMSQCLKVTPKDQAPSNEGKVKDRYNKYKEECKSIVAKIQGPDFVNKPKTREQALLILQSALEMAQTENIAKNEKIETATKNVDKGKKWIKDTTNKIKLTIILATAAQAIAMGWVAVATASLGFNAPAWSKATRWAQEAVLLSLSVSTYYLMELIRARKFTEKWQNKLLRAKHFTHLTCNFTEAKSSEQIVKQIGNEHRGNLLNQEKEKEQSIKNTINSYNGKTTSTSIFNKFNLYSLIPSFLQSISAVEDQTDQEEKKDKLLLSRALRIGTGSRSFQYFLTEKNIKWQEYANDITNYKKAGALSTNSNFNNHSQVNLEDENLDILNLNSTNIATDRQIGLPIVETRINSIAGLIEETNSNLEIMGDSIYSTGYIRDNLVNLLNDMRNGLNLARNGLGNTDTEQRKLTSTNGCIANSGSNKFLIDPNCKCKKGGTCSTFIMPSFKGYPKGVSARAGLAIKTANASISGDTLSAATNSASLAKNATGIKIKKMTSKFKSNFDSKKYIAKRENKIINNFNKSFGVGKQKLKIISLNNKINQSGTINKLTTKSSKNRSKDVKPYDYKNKDTSQFITNSISKVDKDEDKLNFDDDEVSSESNNIDVNTYKHHRRKISSIKSKVDISKKKGEGIFSIISKRYRKTAFPRLLRR